MPAAHTAPEQAPSLAARIASPAFFAALFACLAWYIHASWHWPIVRDTSIMHYVVFLMRHGFKPYAQITDNNLPGAYLAERLGMTIFGTSDLAWRLADWSTLLVITLSSISIAKPYAWQAGLFSGGMFALLHGSEGPDFPMEREEIVAALLILGLALLLTSIRRRQPVWTLLFGLATGAAATIKPTTAPFALGLLACALFAYRRSLPGLWRYLLAGLAGLGASLAVAVGFMLWYHVLPAFIFLMRVVMPNYVSMANRTTPQLLRALFPLNLIPVTAVAILLAVLAHRRPGTGADSPGPLATEQHWTAEHWLILAGVAFGCVSFFAQHKGSIYHRYPFLVFLLLLIGLEIFTALRAHGLPLALALGALGLTAALSLPHYIEQLHIAPATSTMPFALSLTHDLAAIQQGTDLQRQVECLDLTYGCFSALYHLSLVQRNAFTGDLLLFSSTPGPASDFYRNWFRSDLSKQPPEVFVLSNEWFSHVQQFGAKLATWPEFAAYLQANYVPVISRTFPPKTGKPTTVPGDADPPYATYRIYARRNSPALHAAQRAFSTPSQP